MAYNKRTAATIQGWLSLWGVPPVYLKVISAVFRNSWEERSRQQGALPDFLSTCRTFRCRAWWESIKDLRSQRAEEGLVHAGKGPRCEWEDVFSAAFGTNWRQLRDRCETFKQWQQYSYPFVASVCLNCGLPALGEPSAAAAVEGPARKKRRQTTHALSEAPAAHGEICPHTKWQADSQCFLFIVDCKPLADILGGHAPLLAQDLAAMFERMSSKLFSLLEAGWSMDEPTGDPVKWQRREYNQVADFLVNYTMDCQEDWFEDLRPEGQQINLWSSNFVCHSDGGTRQGSCSAAAWIVERVVLEDGRQVVQPFARGGTYLKTPVSSFLAEAVALDEGMSYLHRIIEGSSPNMRKRARVR